MAKSKALSAYLKNRLSTLRYSLAQDMCPPAIPLSEADLTLRSEALALDTLGDRCVYCERNEATTLDHFHALIHKGYPTKFCNDLWNLIPCCTACNSSKGNKECILWLQGDSKKCPMKGKSPEDKQRIIDKLSAYKILMESKCQKNPATKEDFDKILEPLVFGMKQSVERLADFREKCTLLYQLEHLTITNKI